MKINLFKNKILSSFKSMSYIEQKVISYLFENVKYVSINKLASQTSVSVSTISNLCKKLGYDGYKEFSYEYKKNMIEDEHLINDDVSIVSKTYDNYLKNLSSFTEFNFPWDGYKEFCKRVKDTETYMYGTGVNKSIISDIKYRLSIGGKNISIIRSVDEMNANSWVASPNKTIVVLSLSGELPELQEIAKKISKIDNTKIYLITTNKNSLLIKNKLVDKYFLIPKIERYDEFDTISGMVAPLFFFDILKQVWIEMYFDEIYHNLSKKQ